MLQRSMGKKQKIWKTEHFPKKIELFKTDKMDFPGGAVGKNPPASAGDVSSSPGAGRSHMPWSS